jgi:hypothetical protein
LQLRCSDNVAAATAMEMGWQWRPMDGLRCDGSTLVYFPAAAARLPASFYLMPKNIFKAYCLRQSDSIDVFLGTVCTAHPPL